MAHVALASAPTGLLFRRARVARNLDLAGALARLSDIEAVLHAHQSVHRHAERLFDAERHLGRQRGALVQNRGQRRPGDAQDLRGFGDGQPERFDDLVLHEAAGVCRAFHAQVGLCPHRRSHQSVLMVVLVVEIDDLDPILVDLESQPPVLGDEQTPCPLAIPGQPVRLPARDCSEFVLPLHVLQKRNHAAKLVREGRLNPAGVIILDEPPEPLVQDVPNSHGKHDIGWICRL